MSTWVYLFSKFTPEALLFEALIIFVLCGGYAAFWILRKRRLGAIDNAVPAGLVRTYLTELITDAEQMRTQLFGLLSSAGIKIPDRVSGAALEIPAAGVTVVQNPALQQKVQSLEGKMKEQSAAMEAMLDQKEQLEKALAAAKASRATAGSGATASAATGSAKDNAIVAELQSKVKLLEARLAEYSVIEDDLANLKRLQQENAQLKATLAQSGGKLPTPSEPEESILTETAGMDATPTEAPPSEEPAPEESAVEESIVEESAAAPAAEDAPEAASPVAAAEAEVTAEASEGEAAPEFENLVDQVEESLQPEAAAAPASGPAKESDSAPSTSKAEGDKLNKSDADLLAEFEKMLSS